MKEGRKMMVRSGGQFLKEKKKWQSISKPNHDLINTSVGVKKCEKGTTKKRLPLRGNCSQSTVGSCKYSAVKFCHQN